MAIDWDALVLSPTMGIFGEGDPADDESLPLYTPRGLPGFRLPDAVFDAAYAEIELDGDAAGSTTRKPCLGVRLALFPRAPAQSDQVFIPSSGRFYKVKDVQPDGHGHAKLILMEMAS